MMEAIVRRLNVFFPQVEYACSTRRNLKASDVEEATQLLQQILTANTMNAQSTAASSSAANPQRGPQTLTDPFSRVPIQRGAAHDYSGGPFFGRAAATLGQAEPQANQAASVKYVPTDAELEAMARRAIDRESRGYSGDTVTMRAMAESRAKAPPVLTRARSEIIKKMPKLRTKDRRRKDSSSSSDSSDDSSSDEKRKRRSNRKEDRENSRLIREVLRSSRR